MNVPLALPNNYHASIQYGENENKNKVISRHFYNNGYKNYHHSEEEDESVNAIVEFSVDWMEIS